MATTKTTRKTTSSTAQRAKAAGAKAPQDRQSAQADVESTTQIFEWRGLEFEIDTDVFDDVDFLELLTQSLSQALRQLLGSGQYRALKEVLKETDPKGTGRARMSELQVFIEDMQEAIAPLR